MRQEGILVRLMGVAFGIGAVIAALMMAALAAVMWLVVLPFAFLSDIFNDGGEK